MSNNNSKKQLNKLSIGDRMKHNYEFPALIRLPRRLPLIIRIDGKCFHSLAKKLKWKKPFDDDLIKNLRNVALELCKEIMNVKFAYLQSDEISFLLIDYEEIQTEAWFNNEIQKIVSVVSGLASAKLSLLLNHEVSFDARVFVVPPWEVCNYFIWRQKDWARNSVQMLGRAYFSQKQLHGLKCNQIQEKLWKEKDINWAKLSLTHKRGSCIVKKETEQESAWTIDESISYFNTDRQYIEQYVPEIDI